MAKLYWADGRITRHIIEPRPAPHNVLTVTEPDGRNHAFKATGTTENGEDVGREEPGGCPQCGRPLQFEDANSPKRPVLRSDPPADRTYFVWRCPEHGLFHYGTETPLTAGPPPGERDA